MIKLVVFSVLVWVVLFLWCFLGRVMMVNLFWLVSCLVILRLVVLMVLLMNICVVMCCFF